MDIIHLHFNEGASGCIKKNIFEDNQFYEKRMVNVFEEINADPKNFRLKVNDLWEEWENFSHEERNMWMMRPLSRLF